MNFHAGAAFYDLADVATDGSAVHSCAANAVDGFVTLVDAGRLLPVRGQSLLRAERRVGLRPDAVVVQSDGRAQ